MKTVPEKIQRVTSKGQITLPIAWRRKMGNATTITVVMKDDSLIISPLRTEDERDDAWVTLFDAVRDNEGKGVSAKEFARMIRRVNQKS